MCIGQTQFIMVKGQQESNIGQVGAWKMLITWKVCPENGPCAVTSTSSRLSPKWGRLDIFPCPLFLRSPTSQPQARLPILLAPGFQPAFSLWGLPLPSPSVGICKIGWQQTKKLSLFPKPPTSPIHILLTSLLSIIPIYFSKNRNILLLSLNFWAEYKWKCV